MPATVRAIQPPGTAPTAERHLPGPPLPPRPLHMDISPGTGGEIFHHTLDVTFPFWYWREDIHSTPHWMRCSSQHSTTCALDMRHFSRRVIGPSKWPKLKTIQARNNPRHKTTHGAKQPKAQNNPKCKTSHGTKRPKVSRFLYQINLIFVTF